MPIYDYVCRNGHVTEVIHGVHDAGPTVCPVCGEALRKAMSTPAIVFKGSGWAKKERSSAAAKSSTPKDGADPAAKPDTGSTAASSESARSESPKSSPTSTEAS